MSEIYADRQGSVETMIKDYKFKGNMVSVYLPGTWPYNSSIYNIEAILMC